MSALPVYSPPAFAGAIELDLSKNEGRPPRDAGLGATAIAPAALARYPDLVDLQAALAACYGVPAERLLVTAGADDALLRVCLAELGGVNDGGAGGRRNAVVAAPTFEMIPRYVALAGGELRTVSWPGGPLPVAALLAATDADTRLLFVVSPNNPTGAVATSGDLSRLAAGAPQARLVLDAAYAEFATEDPSPSALRLERAIVLRTLSKAWGLAGLRVGCAIATPDVVERLRAAGNPMPVSAASAALAEQRLAAGGADVADHVAAVRRERSELAALLSMLGATPSQPCEGNFVLARGVDAVRLTAGMAALGIAIRRFPDQPALRDAVRITLPGCAVAFARLCAALRTVLAPEALLFDMDGVLVDVTASYRVAIVATASVFGVAIDAADVAAAKARGNANDDWELTRTLLRERGVEVPLAAVTERFEAIYRSLRERETPMVPAETLRRWRRSFPLAVVTGRPRADAEYVLRRHDAADCFDVVVCREDAPLKPDPAPVRLALQRLGVRSAWMLGDTVDDLAAARGAGVLPIAVGLRSPLAAATLAATTDLEDLLR